MGTVPTPETWVTGEKPDYKVMQQRLTVPLRFLLSPPMAKVRRSAAQSIPNNTNTEIQFDTEDIDTDGMFSSTQKTRLTPKTPGWYAGYASFGFVGSTAGTRRAGMVRKNGTLYYAHTQEPPWNASYVHTQGGLSFLESFNGTTDYIELLVFQDSGASMNTSSGAREREMELGLYFYASL